MPEEKLTPKGGPLSVGYYYNEEMKRRGENTLEFNHIDSTYEDLHKKGRTITSRLPKWINNIHRTIRGIRNRSNFLNGKQFAKPRDFSEYDIIHSHIDTMSYFPLKEAKNKCKPVLLEPIMKVVVVAPDEYTGGVIGDITSRRGKPLGQESRGNAIAFTAMVPLAEMFGYATSLRSNTQGRGTFTMVLDHYEEVPKSIAEEIIKKNGGN